MKIVIISNSDSGGGAPIAAHRLFTALQLNGALVSLLLLEKKRNDNLSKEILNNIFKKKFYLFIKYLEKLRYLTFEKNSKERFLFSTMWYGIDISNNKELKDADIINLHWTQQSFLGKKELSAILSLGKPIVFTLHDMWYFTGGCHYSGPCLNFKSGCGNCRFLKYSKASDLSNKIFKEKLAMYALNNNITIHTPSNWLGNLSNQSTLFCMIKHAVIPNCIDTNKFFPIKNNDCPGKRILFQAVNVADERKGFIYLMEALQIIKVKNGNMNLELVVIGNDKSESLAKLDFKIDYLGVITEENKMITAIQGSDVFVITSLEDNLPNSIMEAMSCGIPVVGFDNGGIPEMIEHKVTGYLAPSKNSDEIANGILYCLDEANTNLLSDNARKKTIEKYSLKVVGNQFIDLLNTIDISKREIHQG